MYRNQNYLDLPLKKLLCNSLILPHFDYGSLIFYFSIKQSLRIKLQTAQNKTIRFILNLHPRTHIGSAHFKSLNYLSIDSRVKYFSVVLVYKCLTGLAPPYLSTIFTRPTHNYNTRHSQSSLNIPKTGTNGQKSFSYFAVISWNLLPSQIQNLTSLPLFKYRVKQHLLSLLPD